MSKVVVQKIHPTRSPNHCVISGERDGGDLGFWAGPDIDVVGLQIVTPHVSVRMAKQWLEDAELVVDYREYERLQEELAQARAARDKMEAERDRYKRFRDAFGETKPRRPVGRPKKVTA